MQSVVCFVVFNMQHVALRTVTIIRFPQLTPWELGSCLLLAEATIIDILSGYWRSEI